MLENLQRGIKDIKANCLDWRNSTVAAVRTIERQIPSRASVLAALNDSAKARLGNTFRWSSAQVAYFAQGVSWEALLKTSIETSDQYRFISGESFSKAYFSDRVAAEEMLAGVKVVFVYPFVGYQEILPWLRKSRMVFLITWDDTFDIYRKELVQTARNSDCMLSQTPHSARRYVSINVPWLFWAEGGCACPLPACQPREFRVVYVGNVSGKRRRIIHRLEQRLGDGMLAYGPSTRHGTIPAERALEIQRNASAALALSDLGRGFGLTHFKCRHFEIPCGGGLLLAQYTPGLEKMFVPDKEALMYDSFEDCITKALWIRDHPEEAAQIRRAGHSRAIREHTWISRFQNLLLELDAATRS